MRPLMELHDMGEAPRDDEFVEINTGPPPADAGPADAAPAPESEEPAEEGSGADGEKTGDEAEAGKEGGEGEGEDEAPLRDDRGKFKSGAQARIGELTRARRDAERAADYWKGIATQNGAKPGSDAAPAGPPKVEDFDDYAEFVEALTDYKISDRERKAASTNATNAAQSVERHRTAEWGAKIGAVKSTIADFDAVMEKADTPTASHVAEALMDADRGPELLYHLAKNPEIVERLNEMSPNRAAIELGKIEARLGEPATPPAPPAPKTTTAPAPITPVKPGASTAKDPAKMNQAEYNEWRKGQLAR